MTVVSTWLGSTVVLAALATALLTALEPVTFAPARSPPQPRAGVDEAS